MKQRLNNILIILLELGGAYLLISLAINRGNPLYYLGCFIIFGSSINRLIKLILHKDGRSRAI